MENPRKPTSTGKDRLGLGMREIARSIGLAPITVSRAPRYPGKVSPETRKRILDARASGTRLRRSWIERPQALAEPGRTLAMGRDKGTGTIAARVEAPFGGALAALAAARPGIGGLTARLLV